MQNTVCNAHIVKGEKIYRYLTARRSFSTLGSTFSHTKFSIADANTVNGFFAYDYQPTSPMKDITQPTDIIIGSSQTSSAIPSAPSYPVEIVMCEGGWAGDFSESPTTRVVLIQRQKVVVQNRLAPREIPGAYFKFSSGIAWSGTEPQRPPGRDHAQRVGHWRGLSGTRPVVTSVPHHRLPPVHLCKTLT